MKRIFRTIKTIAYRVNICLVNILLIIVYLLFVTPYSLFYKRKKHRWVNRKHEYSAKELTKMW